MDPPRCASWWEHEPDAHDSWYEDEPDVHAQLTNLADIISTAMNYNHCVQYQQPVYTGT